MRPLGQPVAPGSSLDQRRPSLRLGNNVAKPKNRHPGAHGPYNTTTVCGSSVLRAGRLGVGSEALPWKRCDHPLGPLALSIPPWVTVKALLLLFPSISRKEARKPENLNPVEGLDEFLEPSNADSIEAARPGLRQAVGRCLPQLESDVWLRRVPSEQALECSEVFKIQVAVRPEMCAQTAGGRKRLRTTG